MNPQNPKPPKLQAFLVLALSLLASAASKTQNFLPRGSSLSVGDESAILLSQDQTFSCGFHKVGENAYGFSIWFTNSHDKALAWTANRGRPVSSRGSRVSLTSDGAMELTDVDGTVVWTTNTAGSKAQRAELLSSGNLVIKDPDGRFLWQSFDSPTDTLLPQQRLTKDTKLRSLRGRGSFSTGFFGFYFDSDNVLRMIYEGPDISSLYWPQPGLNVYQNGRTNYNSTRVAILDDSGRFVSSDRFSFNASDYNEFGVKRRLTIDYDGNLRLYSLENRYWNVTFEAMADPCEVHGICGRNGVCVYTPEPKCSCPPGYEVVNSSDWNEGCKAKFEKTCSRNDSGEFKFVQLEYTDFYGYDLDYKESFTFEQCKTLCAENCDCAGFNYRLNGEMRCWTKTALFNGFRSPDVTGSVYLKLPVTYEVPQLISLRGADPSCGSHQNVVMMGLPSMYDSLYRSNKSLTPLIWFALSLGAVEVLFIVSGWWFLSSREGFPDMLDKGYLAISSQFKRFTYMELKKATKSFNHELGSGAFGAVYKGKLDDDREIAVKRLIDVHHGEEGFWAEVSTIGKFNHMNLVRMFGYCYDRKNKLLVYEYVKNKSLDLHLFSSQSRILRWHDRFKIALGTARGLAYLHHECLEWVFHCDVKPENILLDEGYEPKIADFGLAKLSQRDSPNGGSEISRIRGTKGYMAPEWALNLPITSKVDVYGFGVVVLELVRGVRLSGWAVEDGEEREEAELARFVRTVRRKAESGEELVMEEVVDARLDGEFSRNQARKMVEIGMACVEEDRSKRPTMDLVVQVLLESGDENGVDG